MIAFSGTFAERMNFLKETGRIMDVMDNCDLEEDDVMYKDLDYVYEDLQKLQKEIQEGQA